MIFKYFKIKNKVKETNYVYLSYCVYENTSQLASLLRDELVERKLVSFNKESLILRAVQSYSSTVPMIDHFYCINAQTMIKEGILKPNSELKIPKTLKPSQEAAVPTMNLPYGYTNTSSTTTSFSTGVFGGIYSYNIGFGRNVR